MLLEGECVAISKDILDELLKGNKGPDDITAHPCVLCIVTLPLFIRPHNSRAHIRHGRCPKNQECDSYQLTIIPSRHFALRCHCHLPCLS
jgi:hypothetical protein